MRILAMVLVLVLLLAACGQPAGSVRTPGMRVQLADVPNEIPAAGPVNPDPRVGPIFLAGLNLHTCTGSVVHSSSGDLILTAAHCLAKQFKATFVPGFANAAAPSNVWTVDAVYLDPLWVAFRDPRVDYAFARVSRPGGGSIEAQVGSALLLGTAPAPGSQVSIIGYAAGVGGTPIGCQTRTGTTLVVTPRSCVRAWSTAPAARRGSSGRRSPGSPAASSAAGARHGCRIQRRLTNAPQRYWPVPKPVVRARPRRSPSSLASCRPATCWSPSIAATPTILSGVGYLEPFTSSLMGSPGTRRNIRGGLRPHRARRRPGAPRRPNRLAKSRKALHRNRNHRSPAADSGRQPY